MLTQSYYGVVRAGKGFLLGGVKEHRSVRFPYKKDAEDWVDTVKKVNLASGRDVCSTAVVGSSKPHELKTYAELYRESFGETRKTS